MSQSRRISKAEAAKVVRGLYPGANYLIRLRERMVKAGFSPTDPLFELVVKAQDAMQSLYVQMHYASCSGGIGRSE